MDARLISGTVAVVGTASFAGVMLAIGLILGAWWRSLPAQEFLDWFALNDHFVGRIIPLVAGPAVLGIIAALWLDWNSAARVPWLISLAAFAAIFLITVVYHLPTNAMFAAKSVAVADVPATLQTWLSLHYLRIALGFGSAIAAVVAFARH